MKSVGTRKCLNYRGERQSCVLVCAGVRLIDCLYGRSSDDVLEWSQNGSMGFLQPVIRTAIRKQVQRASSCCELNAASQVIQNEQSAKRPRLDSEDTNAALDPNRNVLSVSGGGSTALSSDQIAPNLPAESEQPTHQSHPTAPDLPGSESTQQSNLNTTIPVRPITEAPAAEHSQTTQPPSSEPTSSEPTSPPPLVVLSQNDMEKVQQIKIESQCRVAIGTKCKKKGCKRCSTGAIQATYRAAIFVRDVCVLRAKDSTANILGKFQCIVCDPMCESPNTMNQTGFGNMWLHAEGKHHFGEMLKHQEDSQTLVGDALTLAHKAWMRSMGLETKAEATARRRSLHNSGTNSSTGTQEVSTMSPFQSLLAPATGSQASAAPAATQPEVPPSVPVPIGGVFSNMSGMENPTSIRA